MPRKTEHPIVLASLKGTERLPDTAMVTLSMAVVRAIQNYEPFDTRHSNTHQFHEEDPEIPASQPDYQTLHRLCFGKDADKESDRDFQRAKAYMGNGMLTDREVIVMMAINWYKDQTGKGMHIKRIARALRIQPAHVRKHKYYALKKMKQAPPVELIEARIRKMEALRETPPEPVA